MRKFKAETASLNIDQDKDQFSQSQLNYISASAVGKPIFEEFNMGDAIGKIVSSKVKDGKVLIQGMIDIEFSGRFIVPGGPIRRDKTGKLVEFKADIFGCVKHPTDKSLTPIEYINNIEED